MGLDGVMVTLAGAAESNTEMSNGGQTVMLDSPSSSSARLLSLLAAHLRVIEAEVPNRPTNLADVRLHAPQNAPPEPD